MGVVAYLSAALCGARTRTKCVLIMVSDADTRRVGRMNSWWIFSGFFGYTFVVLNLVGESVYSPGGICLGFQIPKLRFSNT